ncbi:DUF488 domain-containing protein [Dickeya chrysanthemi]|uniref:DUF488 domain-containing protein n=1 Tax=Dickeya chrysanthemi TaxID=556 RepID=UPI000586ABD2|nr:DUF488 family protein [Dickeya chrysanthemi]
MNEPVQLMRVYDAQPPFSSPTFLVDRLWPRGIAKSRLPDVVWLKEVAPSHELRRWYHANPIEWEAFAGMYRAELSRHDVWQPLAALLRRSEPITLLYGSRDKERNHAIVLRDFLAEPLTISERG